MPIFLILSPLFPLPPSLNASPPSRFVKRSEIPEVKLSSVASKRKVVTLSEKGLISLFTGLSSSHRLVEIWLNKNCRTLIQGEVQQIFCGKGYFAFMVQEECILTNGIYPSTSKTISLRQFQYGSIFPTSPFIVGMMNILGK